MSENKTKKEMGYSQEWALAKPEKLPRLTYWPIVLAGGILFFFWGFITSFIISIVGLLITAFALFGWIEEFSDGYK